MITLVHMLLASLLSWWYGLGWVKLMQKVGGRVKGALDFFSVGQLAGSLFAPYRQISASKVQGTLGDELRGLADSLFSRAIGAVIRLMLIFVGVVSAATLAAIGGLLIAVWPFLPVMPLIALFLIQVRIA